MRRRRSLRKSKRGVSTVLGTLIFVGVLMTAVIPLYIYVNHVNNLYDATVVDMKIADKQRDNEALTVYAYGENATSTMLKIFFINTGSFSLNVTRIWLVRFDLQKMMIFNSTNLSDLPLQLLSSSQTIIGNISIADLLEYDETKDYFNVYVVTQRGNKFASQTNSLHRLQDGTWETGTQNFEIQVIIHSDWGINLYKIEVFGPDEYYDSAETLQTHGEYFLIMPVPRPGFYNVTVSRKQGQNWVEIGSSSNIGLSWNSPSALREFWDTE